MTPVGVIVGVGGVGGDKQRTHLRLDLLLDLCKNGRGKGVSDKRGVRPGSRSTPDAIGRIVSLRTAQSTRECQICDLCTLRGLNGGSALEPRRDLDEAPESTEGVSVS